MAIYHLSVKPVSRGGGRSATAASAYRSAEKVHDLTTDQVFDYRAKRGVEHSEIVLPTEAAKQDINWARDRQALWNAAEMAEKRKDARVAREYEVALPHELNHEQRVELVRTFSAELANRYGVAVDFSIHAPHRHGDERNHHAHIMATTREITANGLGEKAAIEWSDTDRRKDGLGPAKEEIAEIRGLWAGLTNEKLQEHGHEIRIDHRSLEAQGIEREPTVHLGPAVSGMERRGIETEVGKRLELEALEAGQRRLEKAAELGKLERETAGLERSILDLSGDLESAKRERNQQQSQERQRSQKPKSIEELQREGRKAWLAMRAEQKAAELLMARTPAQVVGLGLEQTIEKGAQMSLEPESAASPPAAAAAAPALDLEQIKTQGRDAAKRWAQEMAQQKAQELKRQQELEQQRELERSQSRGRGRSLSRGLGRDGPEHDHDLEM